MNGFLGTGFPILSLMLLVPLAAAVACLVVPREQARTVALVATLVDLVLGAVLWANYDVGGAQWQFTENAPLFAGFAWKLGIDGIHRLSVVRDDAYARREACPVAFGIDECIGDALRAG